MADRVLIDQLFFDAGKADVPDLHFEERIAALDHGWHEFHAFSATTDAPTDAMARSIEESIEALRPASVDDAGKRGSQNL